MSNALAALQHPNCGRYGLALLWTDDAGTREVTTFDERHFSFAKFARVSEDHALVVWFKTPDSLRDGCLYQCPIARVAGALRCVPR